MKYSEMDHIVNFTKPQITSASLKGHSVTNLIEIGAGGLLNAAGRKMGPRECRYDGGKVLRLASERAGIKPMKYSELDHTIDFDKPKITKSSLQGFSTVKIQDVGGMGGGLDTAGRKMGPYEARHQGGKVRLASERAGIKPMKYSEVDWGDPKKLFALLPTKSSLQGFSTIQVNDVSGGNFGGTTTSGRKLGPRDVGKAPKLASERMGIRPMKYSEIDHSQPLFELKPTKSSLKGFSTSNIYEEAGAGFLGGYGRKLGPRDIGRGQKLESERRGIRPMKYSEIDHQELDFKLKPTKSSMQGFSTTTIKDDGGTYGGMDASGRKLGPREIGRSTTRLASEKAGIRPVKYSEIDHQELDFKLQPTKSSMQGLAQTGKFFLKRRT